MRLRSFLRALSCVSKQFDLDRPSSLSAKRLTIEELETRSLPTAGLVAAYNFDQGTGSVLTDVSGNNNNGTISNASWVTNGKFGGALSFNGALNSLVDIPNSSSLQLTTGMTLEAWVDPKTLNSPDSGWSAAISKEHRNSSNDISYALYAADGTGTGPGGHILSHGSDFGAQGNSTIPLNQWTFLVATYDGTNLNMYVNGNVVATQRVSGGITSTTNPLRIGGDWSGEMFTGLIDNVRIYNAALSQSAIQADMNTPVGGQVSSAPTVHSVTPINGATQVATSANIAITFTGAVDPSTVNTTTVQLLGPGNVAVTAAVSFNSSTDTATLAPSSTLAAGTAFSVIINGGSTGAVVKDTSGNPLAANYSSAFTTAAALQASVTGLPNSSNSGAAVMATAQATGGAAGQDTYSWLVTTNGTTFASGTGSALTFTPGNGGTYVVALTVTDSSGKTASAGKSLTVNDVAPTVKLTAPSTGLPAQSLSFSATATDPSPAETAAGFTFTWTFGDGSTASGAAVTHTYAATGTFVVTVKAAAADGLVGSASSSVAVGSMPSATFTGPTSVSAGSTNSTVTFSGPKGGTGGYTYSYDFNDSGTFEITASTNPTATIPESYVDSGPSILVVHGRITDSSGNHADYTTSITINDVAPIPTITPPASLVAGTAATFKGSATDPSIAASNAGFVYSWNFGDGSGAVAGASPSHTYANGGTYTVTLTATDKAGSVGTTTLSVTIAPASSGSGQVFPNNVNPPALPAPTGTVITVSTVTQLQNAVANLQSGQTILISPGNYNLTGTLYVPQNLTNIAIRGASGKASDVVIKGDAVIDASAPYTGSAIWGAGSGISGTMLFGVWLGNVQGVTIADMTIEDFVDDAIILNAGVQSPLIHDVVMIDVGEQFVKSNPNGSGGGVNNGIVEYSTMEYTTAAPNNYTNGIDIHTGQNWIIRNNLFKNIFTTNPLTTDLSGALAGPAVLIWNGSNNCTTINNTFINCQREIAYGLSDPSTITDDNSGGLIANNFIYRSGSQHGDVSIGVWNSPNTEVADNTIILNGDYVNAIEYRFTTTIGVKILYNLTDAAITARDGATGTVTGNVTTAKSSWFVNEAIGDLHLTTSATPAIGHGGVLPEVPTDYDGQPRPTSSAPDVGADQLS